MNSIRLLGAMLFLVAALPAAAQQKAGEQTYAISGETGIELYESIGRNGPNGAIAETRFNLKWLRLFDEEDGDCRLVRFRPQLSITIVLPKPTSPMNPSLEARWNRFIDGVREHELVHVRYINDLVEQTQAAVVGASVKSDRTCAKVKREVSRRIDASNAAYKQRSRDFDRDELGEGGTVHRLVLGLVSD